MKKMPLLNIAIIQSDLFWEDRTSNMKMFEEKLKQVPNQTHLVILPEMFTTGFTMNVNNMAESMDGETILWMKKMAQQHKIILTGSVIIKEVKNFYNRLIWMMPNGDMGFYDKRHLFGFAKEDQYYTAGTTRLIAGVNGWKINLQICYDLRFPVWSRQQIQNKNEEQQAEYDLLIYVANWPEKRSEAWKSLLCARAIENQSYVIGVNRVGTDAHGNTYSGESSIINPLGEIIYQKKNEEDIYSVQLDQQTLYEIRNQFPFLKDIDSFHIEN